MSSQLVNKYKPTCDIHDAMDFSDSTNSDEDSLLDVSVGEMDFKYIPLSSSMWISVDTEFLIENYSDIIEGSLLDILRFEDGTEFLLKHINSFSLNFYHKCI